MKRRSLITLGIGALALLLIVPLAFAGGPGRRGGGWGDGTGRGQRGERMAQLLGLNDQQKAEMQVLREDLWTDIGDIQTQIKAKHDAMKPLLKQATPDRAKILALTKEIGALHQKILELRVDHVFAIKGVLTAEQFQKFVDLRGALGGHGMRGMRGGRGGGGPGMGPGMGGGFGPGMGPGGGGMCDGTGPCGFGPPDDASDVE